MSTCTAWNGLDLTQMQSGNHDRKGRCSKEPWGPFTKQPVSFTAGLLLGGLAAVAIEQLKETRGTAVGNRPHFLAVLSVCPRNTRMGELPLSLLVDFCASSFSFFHFHTKELLTGANTDSLKFSIWISGSDLRAPGSVTGPVSRLREHRHWLLSLLTGAQCPEPCAGREK